MIKIELSVITTDVLSRTITWTIEPTSESLSNYVLDVYKSELNTLNSGLYDIVISGLDLSNTFYYTDNISGYHTYAHREYWYLGKIRNTSTDGYSYTNQATLSTLPDNISKMILRQKNWGLQNRFGGEKFVLLKRKTFGDTCPNCYDAYTQRRTLDQCEVCFDTTISGGYYSPITVQGMMNASPKRSQMVLWGDFRPGDAVIYTTSYPHVQPKDIFVDQTNRRWEIIQVRTVEKGQFIIEQASQARRLLYDDIVYQFNVSGYLY